MKFYTNYKKYVKHKETTDKLKDVVEKEIGKILYKLKFCVSPNPHFGNKNLSIKKIVINKDLYHPFAGTECFEIWETDDDEYARSYLIPTSIFKTKDYKKAYFKLLADYKLAEKERYRKAKEDRKEAKEKNDLKEFKRLKRKFKNK